MNNQQILDRLQELQLQIDELRNYIISQEVESSKKKTKRAKRLALFEYQTFFSWEQKIVFILKFYQRPLLSSEIVSFLDTYDTVFIYKRTELDKLKMLSTHLNRTVKKGAIKQFKKPGMRGYYYAIKLDEQ